MYCTNCIELPYSYSHHSYQSPIPLSKCSRLHVISAQSCHVSSYQKHNTCVSICRTPNSSFFPLQQFPERISLLIWMICTMGGKWLYSFCFMG